MIFIDCIEHLPDFILGHRRHILDYTTMELFPTDTTISVVVHLFELLLKVRHQLSVYEVMRNVGHYSRLELIHLTKFFKSVQLFTL